jgi:dipeptidyl aminopeptidase/acylaminoacyl peptidase
MRTLALLIVLASCALGAQSAPDAAVAQKRAAFLKVIDRPRVDLAPAVRPMTANGLRLVQEHFSFGVDRTQRVTGLVVKSLGSTGRLPVVIQLHGTGGRKEQLLPRLMTLANRGFIAVAIDGRYHGERAGNAPGLETPYTTAIYNAYTTGREHPFFYDTVLDVMRLIDYLETRPDVDASRIGLGGLSKGGIETYLAAAVDPRVAVSVSERGVQSFKWALDHGAWDSRAWTFRDALEAAADETKTPVTAAFVRQFYDRVAPGIYGEFDAPAMLPMIAPRPLLVINGDSDPRTPMAGVRESAAAAERAYKAAGAGDKFMLKVVPNLGHENTPEIEAAMVAWFVRWLKP